MVSSMISTVARGLAASWTATSSLFGFTSRSPANTDSIRVLPPTMILLVLASPASRHNCPTVTSKSSLVTTMISEMEGLLSNTQSVRRSTGISPSGRSTLSSPIRVECPEAATMAVQLSNSFFLCPNRRPKIPMESLPVSAEKRNPTGSFFLSFHFIASVPC